MRISTSFAFYFLLGKVSYNEIEVGNSKARRNPKIPEELLRPSPESMRIVQYVSVSG